MTSARVSRTENVIGDFPGVDNCSVAARKLHRVV
jgi:hypothetical protein